ncbi:30S ribosomal protein S18 [Ehrlichia ruminantium]|uniref:Small ribosomal subunit protein bS18 n=3 Tax=Ehrlichia ruminantium TaxID=779 RepID=RS18_EHRRG|nr:30S ribosomal protein S18 [Ehrlichia ruminantium]Q5FG28.1 RecName: Full=Small ribosomal subunit protein bS18; AltName: Full=30S ribosomal protein S18 [Ehrlichia ruminantium str. Gardel]Q5HAJ5.1 RecName: Full=Small ribosomal subunit protein bS18; AltName: Full=30S ribosomal protein S18 [Ehrlichia ruminantium str. Welgevonden]KYW90656.1 30S ribosomal protein S18 [Ehrlichia ruminantium]QLK50769.1 30S ribosomal protein S18 [Ehrlichia ruminantium]QLK51691.1 30S ribosomal protein S18 [Ehrlichia r
MLKKGKKTGSNSSGGTAYSPLAYLKRPYFRRSKACPLEQCANEDIDYKNKALLSKFTSEYGRILPSRITSVSSRKQRLLSTAIKRARYLALLPYC